MFSMLRQYKWMTITGWVLTVLVTLALLMSGGMKVARAEVVTDGFAKQGFPEGVEVPIGIVEILCALIFVFPRTAPLGAILVVGYLGGATVTHVRLQEPVLVPVLMGVIAWLGLFFREPRVRAILPWMTSDGPRDVN